MEHTSTRAFLLVLTAPASAKQSVEEATEGKKIEEWYFTIVQPILAAMASIPALRPSLSLCSWGDTRQVTHKPFFWNFRN